MAMQVAPIPFTRCPTGSCLICPGWAGVLNFGLSVRRITVAPGKPCEDLVLATGDAGKRPVTTDLAPAEDADRAGKAALDRELPETCSGAGTDDVGLVTDDEIVGIRKARWKTLRRGTDTGARSGDHHPLHRRSSLGA